MKILKELKEHTDRVKKSTVFILVISMIVMLVFANLVGMGADNAAGVGEKFRVVGRFACT
ncbi:MAG: hypothetical protein KAR85_08220 [Methanosarcinales archaeon]|nr:hypothetical protein [Methanosarcinales archaeon]